MARYSARDVFRCLHDQGCVLESERPGLGLHWSAADGMPFTLPFPAGGWFEADVVDEILAERGIWLCTSPRRDQESATKVLPIPSCNGVASGDG